MKKILLMLFVISAVGYANLANEDFESFTSSTIDINVKAYVGSDATQLVITDKDGVQITGSIEFNHDGLKTTTSNDIETMVLKAKQGNTALTTGLSAGFDYVKESGKITKTSVVLDGTNFDNNATADKISTTLETSIANGEITVKSTLSTSEASPGTYNLTTPEKLTVVYTKTPTTP